MRYDELVRDDRVHASLYTDPAIFADEMEQIFHRGWVFVGHASEIPGPGDFVTRTIGTQAVVRDWGHGHIEIDWSPGYQGAFEWFGGASPSLTADYVAAMERRYGTARTQQLIFEGPAHALIFPNLFLGETNVAIVQPVSVNECVHWHTPMFWKGVPQFRSRLLRQSEAGMGPASFLMPEDLAIAARNQAGLQARHVEWLELSRGLNREVMDAEGRAVSHVTDETINRALWKQYRAVMTGA